ncbi:MAG: carboxypeptidase-like regulatory domain-containing protein [Terriglobia bacterium]
MTTQGKKPGNQQRCFESNGGSSLSRLRAGAQSRLLYGLAASLLPVLALFLLTTRLEAKKKPPPTKQISGAVLNSSNHGVEGASVFLTDLQTHHTDAIYSGSDGAYSFSGLNPHDDYQLRARYEGSVSDTRNASSFDLRPSVVINLVLGPPGVARPAPPQN